MPSQGSGHVTVRQLIDLLQDLPPEAPVYVRDARKVTSILPLARVSRGRLFTGSVKGGPGNGGQVVVLGPEKVGQK